MYHSNKVLAVDLDGTFIQTDLLLETLTRLFYSKPWLLLMTPLWLLKGKAHLKQQVAERVSLNIESLPYNTELIHYLEEEKKTGREIVLCTGSWHTLAKKVSSKFPFFSDSFGTTKDTNLTGKNKAKFLVETYQSGEFSYAGNEKKDLNIWSESDSAILVSSDQTLKDSTKNICEIEACFLTPKLTLKAVIKQLRVHQWIKNLLIFAAIITAHKLTDAELVINSLMAFAAYCLCASATYILNDLADLENDRQHETKRNRPLAAGVMSITKGVMLSVFLLAVSLVIAFNVSDWFLISLLLYVAITLAYSFKLKTLHTFDITVLASLYTLRIISGSAAIAIAPSFWFLAFSMFLFLSLAIVKRLSEIYNKKDKFAANTQLKGRGYFVDDFQVLLSLASTSGLMSIMIFALYINSPDITRLYMMPEILWLACPIFAYWIIRVIIMASRGQVHGDPIVFAIKDKNSWFVGAAILAIVFFAGAI